MFLVSYFNLIIIIKNKKSNKNNIIINLLFRDKANLRA